MTNSQKWKIIVVTVFLPLIVLVVLCFFMMLANSFNGGLSVKNLERKAVDYINEKYGETVEVISSSPSYSKGNGLLYRANKIKVDFDGFSVFINDGMICDNRQYDEICEAVKERYFDDDTLGSSFTGELSLEFTQIEEQYSYTSVLFDGDIEKFISDARPILSASITYEGYPEKYDEYRQLLNDKLSEIQNAFYNDRLDVHIYVHNPDLNLAEMPYKAIISSMTYTLPRYEEYMELIAFGHSSYKEYSNDEAKVFQAEFYEIDEYTAVSDDRQPILSEDEVVFEKVDLSNDTTVHRGRFKSTEEKDLTIRNEGLKIELSGHGHYNTFLRLDRNHYDITDSTVPLLVADNYTGNHQYSRRYYLTVGYNNQELTDTNYDDWYYLDDDYLYLYITSIHSDFNSENWVLTFSDV